MRKRTAVTTVALSLSGLLVLACAIPEPDAPFGPADPDSTALITTTDVTPDPSASRASFEDLYNDYDAMDDYVDAVVGEFLNPWLNETWPGMREPFVMYVPSGATGPQDCTDFDGNPGFFTGFSYEYCPADMTVYLGQDTLWEFFSETGDAGPAMGMAHEYGHHIQYQLGVRSPRTAAESVEFENQADCASGAWARWMQEREALETEDDLRDIGRMFPIIASAEDEGADRDHGTIEEREQAFSDGFRSGPAGCGLA